MLTSGEIYDGHWEKGRRHGIGVLDLRHYQIKLKYSYGIPTKILEFPIERLGNKGLVHLPFSTSFKPYGNYYKEVILDHGEILQNSYILVYDSSKRKICFDGKLIKNSKSELIFGDMGYFSYIVEKNTKNQVKGMFELNFGYFLYTGQGENCVPEGKGKLICPDEIKVSGYFTKGMLQGIGKIKGKDFRSSCNLVDGIPNGDYDFTYQGTAGSFFINPPAILINTNNLALRKK